MTLTELLSPVQQLPDEDKIKLIRIFAESLDEAEVFPPRDCRVSYCGFPAGSSNMIRHWLAFFIPPVRPFPASPESFGGFRVLGRPDVGLELPTWSVRNKADRNHATARKATFTTDAQGTRLDLPFRET